LILAGPQDGLGHSPYCPCAPSRGSKNGEWTGREAAAHFEQVARKYRLPEAGEYDPKLVDMLISRVRQTRAR
jgi:hypothetical protein